MTPLLDAFMIVRDEEHLLPYALQSMEAVASVVGMGVMSVIDNGSVDGTLALLKEWEARFGLVGVRLVVRQIANTPHHGELRTAAIKELAAPWIFYLDADETVSRDTPARIRWAPENDTGEDAISFERYWTHTDKYHWAGGYEPAQVRLFRNYDGVHFPQKIHTEPMYSYGSGLMRRRGLRDCYIFDHTSCKSQAALREKGERYQWAQGEAFIGDPDTYVRLTEEGREKLVELPSRVKALVEWGPG